MIKGLRDLVGKLKLLSDIDIATVELLQDHDDRISKLEDQVKKHQGLIDGHSGRLFQIEQILGDWRKKTGN